MELKVIVANELRSYRQILACAIEMARPDLEVTVVAPGRLKAEIENLEPDLVVCSCARAAVQAGTRAWVELYADHGPVSMVCIDGQRSSVRDMELGEILDFMDRALSDRAGGGRRDGDARTPLWTEEGEPVR